MENESINGLLRDAGSGNVVPGVQVQAWDTEKLLKHPIGTDESLADGSFTIPIAEEIRKALIERGSDVFFRLFHKPEFIVDTRDSVLWHPRQPASVVIKLGGDQDGQSGQSGDDGSFDVHGRVV